MILTQSVEDLELLALLVGRGGRGGPHLLLPFFNETFKTLAPVRRRGLPTEANGNRRQDGTFPAAIMPYDKIDEWTEENL